VFKIIVVFDVENAPYFEGYEPRKMNTLLCIILHRPSLYSCKYEVRSALLHTPLSKKT